MVRRVFLLDEVFFCLATRLAMCLVVASAIPEIGRQKILSEKVKKLDRLYLKC